MDTQFRKGNKPWNKGKRGLLIHTKKTKKSISKAMKGRKSPNWKRGFFITKRGYKKIHVRGKFADKGPRKYGKYFFEHRLVMEKHLGRKLFRHELIHHKNGIKTDNRINNLQIMSFKDHSLYHLDHP